MHVKSSGWPVAVGHRGGYLPCSQGGGPGAPPVMDHLGHVPWGWLFGLRV